MYWGKNICFVQTNITFSFIDSHVFIFSQLFNLGATVNGRLQGETLGEEEPRNRMRRPVAA